MKAPRLLVFILATLLSSAAALAQPHAQPIRKNEYPIEPAATDTIGCAWERIITDPGVVLSVSLINVPAHADASPASIIIAGPTGAASHLSVTIAPDTGCGTSGCRVGNDYRIKLRATDSDGNHPICNLVVKVRQEVL